VEVAGASDVVNTRTTTTGANITSELLQQVPVGRHVAAATYLAPGVSSSGTAGADNPSIAGGSGLDNQYVIDGVFFGAINPGREARSLQAPDGFPLRAMGDIDRVRDTLTYSTKATWQLGNGHRIDASFFGDPSSGDIGPQRTSALLVGDTASFSSLTYGGHNQTLRYNGVLSNS